ncbi:MAG: Gmad2 immunoglobulin-like domain-containing protein [Parcubacteria group bacterium]
MKKRNFTLILILAVVITAAAGFIVYSKRNIAVAPPLIGVSSLKADDAVKSPLEIFGQARGNWYFEASFPVKIFDANGVLLGSTPAQAQGDWMTTNFVPFKATLKFPQPLTSTGKIIFEKDNPSGLPQNADKLEMPVRFESSAPAAMRSVNLFYYDASKDVDAGGNLLCTKRGLVPVVRNIPVTMSPIQDTLRLFLKGDLTPAEKAQGITTEFPLSGMEMTGVALNSGVLALTFYDPENQTGGGSCRVGILWSQIKATAMQFPEVKSVKFSPEALFQP